MDPLLHHKLDVFHKYCLRIIWGYTLEDRISNADLFTKCDIYGIESFLIQSQLRWAGHIICMSNNQTCKILMCSQLQDGSCNVNRPLLCYKDKVKHNLKSINICFASLESVPSNHTKWRILCVIRGSKIEKSCLKHLCELK